METEDNSVKKPPCDPGWNDPPLFSYDSHTAQIKNEKRGNILNKRVPFPLHSNVNASHKIIDPTLPPQPCDPTLLPPPPLISNSTTNSDVSAAPIETEVLTTDTNDANHDIDLSEALSTTMKNFNAVLESKIDNEDLKEKVGEIRKRLDIIEKMWNDDKFNTAIQQKLLELSEAVKSGDIKKADHLQKSLMVDHASLCSSWMAGIRHILHSL